MFSALSSQTLDTPHIPIGASLRLGMEILQSIGDKVTEQIGSEHCFKVDTATFSIALFARANYVASVWYDDPLGRESPAGRERKIELYLLRYGALVNWELRLVNNAVQYWINPKDQAAMVYGLEDDSIRFNQYYEEFA